MATFISGTIMIEVDNAGFMEDPQQWNREIAAALAKCEGVASLGDDHWKLLQFLRDHYLEHGVAPLVRQLCAESGLTLKQIYALFPSGPARGACKVAGLPNPDACV
jgi:TusE/DsrC/DsvC family sulfur relay protein